MQKGADRQKELNTHQAADSSGRMQNNSSTLSFDRLDRDSG
jgi:hypothetical protein